MMKKLLKNQFCYFPRLQGGPLVHVIAAKAVAFENFTTSWKDYAKQVKANAKILGSINERGYDLVSGGTDNHLV